MSQSSVIAAYLIIGFLVWVTLTKQLAGYRDVLGI